MGKSDGILNPWYKQAIVPKGRVALLGFQDNNIFSGDLYDLQIGNWDINDDWSLDGTYDTIISLRCPYFAKNPQQFMKKCHDHLNDGGVLYTDWGLGDHWRFKDYKIGWVKEHVHPYWITTCTFNGSQKAAFAHPKAVLIDDREININEWINSGGIGILHISAENTISELNGILKRK